MMRGWQAFYSVAMATTPLNDHCKNSQPHQFQAEQALTNVSTSYFISSSSFMKQKIHSKIIEFRTHCESLWKVFLKRVIGKFTEIGCCP
jgi:hypothetical protein